MRRRRDGEPNALPGPRQRVSGRAVTGIVAGEVAAAHPSLCRAGVPVVGLLRGQRDRFLRHPVHRALSAGTVRLQRRCAALVVAGGLILPPWGGAPPPSPPSPPRTAGPTPPPPRPPLLPAS